MDQPRHAAVFCKGKRAGLLTKTAGGYEFRYEADYLSAPDAAPISLAMPLRREKFESRELFPFFDGLLPEGWLLDLTCAAAKIDKNDKFRLLLHTGQDPVGAVSVRPLEDESHG
ncbi:MAG: HipA N-terminal domain-containing protein [Elusimicrobia bacterium]|nr:HipA N-terminal domain-containing protein [Elusimicrobiota bacterium]